LPISLKFTCFEAILRKGMKRHSHKIFSFLRYSEYLQNANCLAFFHYLLTDFSFETSCLSPVCQKIQTKNFKTIWKYLRKFLFYLGIHKKYSLKYKFRVTVESRFNFWTRISWLFLDESKQLLLSKIQNCFDFTKDLMIFNGSVIHKKFS
jgi:hypothetical protein